MPSKYTVGLVLCEQTFLMWNDLPIGERSKRVREALMNADIVNERDMLIEALRNQIKALKAQNYHDRWSVKE
jgi:hypothetical protein